MSCYFLSLDTIKFEVQCTHDEVTRAFSLEQIIFAFPATPRASDSYYDDDTAVVRVEL